MTRVLIIGEAYNLGLSIGGGPMPGGPNWGGPVDPGWGVTPPADPGWGNWAGGPHPGNRPPGSWSGEYPATGPVYGGGHPSTGPIIPPQGGTEVPADEYAPLPPPEDIYSQYVVSVWNPKTASWTTKSYPPR